MDSPKTALHHESQPDSGEVDLDRLSFLATLGKGHNGKVLLAESKSSKQLYAVKVIKKQFVIEGDEIEDRRTERAIYQRARTDDCPFIIQLYATFQTETRIFLVLEIASGGDLMFHLQKGQFGHPRAL